MTDYVSDLTSTVHFRREDAERMRSKVETDAVYCDGIMRWKSNDRIPPIKCVAMAAHIGMPVDVVKCTAFRDSETSAFLQLYRKNQIERSPAQKAQDASMAVRELGSDAMNIITGECYGETLRRLNLI